LAARLPDLMLNAPFEGLLAWLEHHV